jgi:hypothetical protein
MCTAFIDMHLPCCTDYPFLCMGFIGVRDIAMLTGAFNSRMLYIIERWLDMESHQMFPYGIIICASQRASPCHTPYSLKR